MVRPCHFLGQWQLTLDAPDSFGRGKSISFLEAGDLCFTVGCDDDRLIHALVDSNFEEQRDVVNDNCVRIVLSSGSRLPQLFACDTRMNDSFKPPPLHAIAEYYRADGLAVDAPIGVENVMPEYLHDLAPCRLVRFNDIPRQFIGIDDDSAALFEHGRDCAFTGGDTTGEAHEDHGGGAYHAACRPTKGD